MKVYVVEFGEYSDRFVSGVYSSRENALVAAGKDGEDVITEYELDSAISEFKSGFTRLRVELDKEGNVLKVEDLGYSPHLESEFRVWRHTGQGTDPSTLYFEGILWVRDREQAIKATNEARAESIASGEWAEKEVQFQEWDVHRIEGYRQYYGAHEAWSWEGASGFTGVMGPPELSKTEK